MYKSLGINSLLAAINRLKVLSLSLIMCAGFLAIGATPGNSQDNRVKIGSTVHLANQFNTGREPQTYLDTMGWIANTEMFKNVSGISDNNWFVFTHTSPNRDAGTGSWTIISATGKKNGETLMYNDQVHLLNGYHARRLPNDPVGDGYLEVWSDQLSSIFKLNKPEESDYPVFASQKKNRKGQTGTWIIRKSGNGAGEVINANTIMLESKAQPGHFLEVNGGVRSLAPFKNAPNKYMVFVSSKEGFHVQSEQWKIILKR